MSRACSTSRSAIRTNRPSAGYVEILRESLIPQHELWFAYNFGDARRSRRRPSRSAAPRIPFEAEDVHLTTGGFTAISSALKIVGDRGDEVIYSLPPWFLYEPIVLEAGLVPVKVPVDRRRSTSTWTPSRPPSPPARAS
jgi:aspartate aminotransferase